MSANESAWSTGIRVFVWALAITAFAQDGKVFRTDSQLVQVDVVVRDGKGPITGLRQEDFHLFDNGKPRKIGAFSVLTSPATAMPVALGKKRIAPPAPGAPRDAQSHR